ncbi:plc-like phosphodiesterase [Fusarium denticulatum]|uniref:Plc-like phosphodiesterase n=1 Tax=Fusarium denticulatum TaxID=48507 RepID=A0A8H5TP30_9HYPO|nr:plc-like phosphodiesterase [Fusarium denticulatum]
MAPSIEFNRTTVAAAPWSEAKPIQPNPNNYGTDFKPAMCEFHGKVFLIWATAPSPWPASFYYTTWLPSDDGWDSPSYEYLGLSRQQAYSPALVVFNDVLYAFVPWRSIVTNNTDAGCAIYSYDGTKFNFVCDWDSRWMGYNQSDNDHFIWAYSEVGTTTITSPAGFSINRIDQQTSSNPALLICFKTHDGPGFILSCRNEAALVYSKSWVYAVWNVFTEGHLMYWSRRPMKSLNPESWMSCLVNQNISISALSIPGTHDSCTSAWHGIPPSPLDSRVRCQDMSITQQLNAGIRYFDIRAGYLNVSARNKGDQCPLIAVHGEFPIGLFIKDALGFFYAWLDRHPTEAVILQLKADGKNTESQCVSDDFYTLVQSNLAKYWVVAETIPTLDQIKGKIQLVRRVPVPNAWGPNKPFGINAYNNWPQDAAGAVNNPLINSGPIASLWVEDNYSFDGYGYTALQKKKRYILDFLTRATAPLAAETAPVWYIGYSSYTTDLSLLHGVPDSNFNYATKNLDSTSMNHSLEEIIKSEGGYNRPKCVGTIVMDYPNWKSGTLIKSIIYTNSLELRK